RNLPPFTAMSCDNLPDNGALLRAAVIAAGLKRLGEGDGAELGLRALARDVGVSATALYRHFPDKEALLDALADEGLRRLGALQAQAWLKAG
ncbi:TetR family transcriptional regulator, partial [Rhizobium johnstonii]